MQTDRRNHPRSDDEPSPIMCKASKVVEHSIAAAQGVLS